MTAHTARLRRDVLDYVAAHGKPIQLSAICEHISKLGWRMADQEMFGEWLARQGVAISQQKREP